MLWLKIPNGRKEVNQLAMAKDLNSGLGLPRNKSSLRSGQDWNSEASKLQVQRSNCSGKLPPYLGFKSL